MSNSTVGIQGTIDTTWPYKMKIWPTKGSPQNRLSFPAEKRFPHRRPLNAKSPWLFYSINWHCDFRSIMYTYNASVPSSRTHLTVMPPHPEIEYLTFPCFPEKVGHCYYLQGKLCFLVIQDPNVSPNTLYYSGEMHYMHARISVSLAFLVLNNVVLIVKVT
jgi:hypothetical protein